jgi:hypothetical protein
MHFAGSTNSMIRSFISGYGNTIQAPLEAAMINGEGLSISKRFVSGLVNGFGHLQQDSSTGSLITGIRANFGGMGQFTSGQFLTNRTPWGTVLGNANVDFATLPYTGTQGTNVANIGSYPVFAIGNSAVNGNAASSPTTTAHSNAVTVLYNGRTQINTTGFTNTLAQTDVTPKAALDVVSTNTGVLFPRLTTAQRNAIASGDLQNGLLLYNTDSSVFQYYNGSAWSSVGSGGSGGSGRWQFGGGVQFDTVNSIGIGTSNTQNYKLAVNGDAIFTKIKVKTYANWPDYVFKRGYHLPSLADLERYINEHHHLPGVASEQEVRTNGIDISDQEAALLKKMEEFTLYLIDQNKDLTEQNRQLKQQAKQLEEQQKEIESLKALILSKTK